LQERMRRILENRKHRLLICLERLKGLSPLEKLSSGYAYMKNENGENIRSVSQVSEGDSVVILVKDGQIDARVTGTKDEKIF
ncbi:MAG: exodeoxyribonuclease VII large subunit, partial [Acetatifactor sp.]|nr:exodeoxyribonuclease VII large subunit [Acetatifactor sp.]